MYNRRQFLRSSATAAIGSLALSKQASAFINPAPHAIGLQLFTLFNIIDEDVSGTLKKVAGIGYREIESAFSRKGGYYGMKPQAFAALLKDLGLSWQSHHALGAPFKLPPGTKLPAGPDGKPFSLPPTLNLQENMQQVVDEAAEGGVSYLVCASTPVETADEVKSSIEVLNKTGEACKKAGIGFAYHNHDREFRKSGAHTLYDMILGQTNAGLVKMELDLCWVTKAGVDPVALFKAHPGRFPLLHVKDIDKNLTGPQPVGTGIVDFRRIFAQAGVGGVKHYFVEHDMPADPFGSITTSFKNISNLFKA